MSSLSSPSDSATLTTTPTSTAVGGGGGSADSTTGKTTKKTIYLIRHAESEENRRIASLSRCFKKLTKFSLPSSEDVYSSAQLLNIPGQIDSNVSDIGQQQITSMGKQLRDVNFLSTENITLIVHSPLLRAKQTCEGLLGYSSATSSATASSSSTTSTASTSTSSTENGSTTPTNTNTNTHSPRVVELDLILEKTPQEWTPLYFNNFLKRIDTFETWISKQPESHIAIVGHSQFFKAMLGLDFKFNNCDVWKFSYDDNLKKKKNENQEDTVVVDDDDVGGETTTEVTPVDVNSDSTTTVKTATWKLPPQWSNMTLLHKCNVESSKKDID